ncbi:macrophage mannose receptor 1-like [Amphiprion ocellaris]|uniref:macrophage mannose receptor 1-like n=1 Tax=Amphiprion ocellaris TaxID=80972 RepID=UPI0024118D78|nr:macrophage mannose receptor 1-like [Amphiprion ocellaris]
MSPACRPGVNEALLCIVLLSGFCSCLHQYQFIDELKTWGEAQQHCREKFTDLATVDNMEDVAQLIAAAGSDYSGRVWIGLYDKSRSWGWSMRDDGYYGTNNEPYIRFNAGEPDNGRDELKLCIAVYGGELYDTSCSIHRPFVCYDNSNTSSPPRYVYKSWRNLTWEEAQSYCRKFHTDLASMRNEEEKTRVQQAVTGNVFAFVGLYRRTWPSWSDGTEKEFKNWLTGRPRGKTGDCATSLIGAADAGKWVEDHCDQKLPFMCHYETKQQLWIKLKALKSTMDLNDPAVMEAILKLLEKKMKEKGIKAGFKLRWIKKPDNTIFQEEKDEL